MKSNKKYLQYTWFVTIMVFLVILAGGVVRMTQSGMGCPDWPTCFGRWIPPTSADQLPQDFEKYLKIQDIDHTFNVYHTWIEYINRLLGALLGVFIFIHFIWSFRKFRRSNMPVVLLSLFLLVAVGFQGWLGKKVVDHNLAVVKVTIHMLVALLIAAIPLIIIYKLQVEKKIEAKGLKYLSYSLIVILLVQIVLGTQVREQIDEISKSLKYQQRELWISRLNSIFIIHRSFSWLVAIGGIALWFKSRGIKSLQANTFFILGCIVATIVAGLVMAFYNVPAIAQPLHLLLACILVLSVFSFSLRFK